MKAPFAYFGGKSGMAAEVVALLPPHRVYLEPFFGSGAVLFAKPSATHEIVNDVDGAVATFFRVLRERPDELADACGLSPHCRDEFVAAADLNEDLDDLELARRFWVRVNQSFAKTAGVKTGWSVTTARTQSVPATALSRIGRFAGCAERLMDVTIENCDALGLIERLATADSAIYVDPPYLNSTRSGKGASKRADYRSEFNADDEHRALAEVLNACPGSVILSGYPAPLYDSLYRDWHRIDRAVTAFSSNALTNGREGRTEVIWLNYDPPTPDQGTLIDLVGVSA